MRSTWASPYWNLAVCLAHRPRQEHLHQKQGAAKVLMMWALVLALLGPACGGPGQGGPTSPSRGRFRLAGLIIRANGSPVVGASVTIVDGAAAGAHVTSNSLGSFAFEALAPGTLTVQAAADSHTSASRRITIVAADLAVDFVLLRAELIVEGLVSYNAQPNPDDPWTFDGRGLNRGDACATNVRGYFSRVDDEGEPLEGQTRTFALAPSTLVFPSERFAFTGCCFSRTELEANALVRVEFIAQSVACP
jgi:hypothetical protein